MPPSNSAQTAMDAALAMLGRRPQSRNRLRIRLEERFDAAEVGPILRRLEMLGLVDDRSYAETLIRHRFERRHYGASYIRGKLLSDGVEPEVVDDVLDRLVNAETERRHAREALAAYLRRPSSSKRDAQAAISDSAARHLSNRGFAAELICDLLRESL